MLFSQVSERRGRTVDLEIARLVFDLRERTNQSAALDVSDDSRGVEQRTR